MKNNYTSFPKLWGILSLVISFSGTNFHNPQFCDKVWKFANDFQGRHHRENLDATFVMVGRICPPAGDRVKVSENLGVTEVAPVAPVDKSLIL